MPKNVSISDAAAKALEEAQKTADEVIREALAVKAEGMETAEGVIFPEGAAFLAWYKDRAYWGHIKNGALDIHGERFNSVSSAAAKIAGRPMNGWDFWQCKLPGKSEFVKISTLRNGASPRKRKAK